MHVNRAAEIAYVLDQITLREAVSQREESDTVHVSIIMLADKKMYHSVSNRRLTFLESINQKLFLASSIIQIKKIVITVFYILKFLFGECSQYM